MNENKRLDERKIERMMIDRDRDRDRDRERMKEGRKEGRNIGGMTLDKTQKTKDGNDWDA